MIRCLLVSFAISLLSTTAISQDTLFIKKQMRRPGLFQSVIAAKITEIDPKVIRYKKYDNPDGPIRILSITYIDSVRYENGTVEKFFTSPNVRKPSALSEHKIQEIAAYKDLPAGLLSVGIAILANEVSLPFTNGYSTNNKPIVAAQIGYERLFSNNKIGVGIAPFIGINRKAYGGMLHAKFYIKSTGKTRFGIGPAYLLHVQNWEQKFYDTESFRTITKNTEAAVSSLALNLTVQAGLSRKVFFTYDFILGLVVDDTVKDKTIPDNWRHSSNSTKELVGFKLGLAYRL